MTSPVLAFAGRRIDPIDSMRPAFPLAAVPRVAARIDEFFRRTTPAMIVSSAACGADLLALRVAGALGIPRTVILPFDRDLFREVSVTDRPGKWDDFDLILDQVATEGRLEVLRFREPSAIAFRTANSKILDRAEAFSHPVIACIAWDGVTHGNGDYSAEFRDAAESRGILVEEICTL